MNAPTLHPRDLPPEILSALEEALKITAWRDGAPKRCPRRACRRDGACHLKLGANVAHDCAGHLSARAECNAVDMLTFIHRLATRNPPNPAPDFELPDFDAFD